jgi:hypothetical protein
MERFEGQAMRARDRQPGIESTGKLETKWVGPYLVIEKLRPGAYHLSDPQGRVLEHSWNA